MVRIRPSDLVPSRWASEALPLLTRGKNNVLNCGALSLSLLWDAAPMSTLAKLYTKPFLPAHYYYHPWTAQQSTLFRQSTKRAVMVYLEHQNPPIAPEVVHRPTGTPVIRATPLACAWAVLCSVRVRPPPSCPADPVPLVPPEENTHVGGGHSFFLTVVLPCDGGGGGGLYWCLSGFWWLGFHRHRRITQRRSAGRRVIRW